MMELHISGVSEGQRARLQRIAKGLRQVDVAAKAGVTVTDVVYFEKDRFLRPSVRRRIALALGLVNEDSRDDGHRPRPQHGKE
jgi:transcriptional regulator with XRE-family HTH domain